MSWTRVLYRIRQFWAALRASPPENSPIEPGQVLTPDQLALFSRLHPSEQAHALNVMETLWEHRERKGGPDLMVAALLHDVGKARYPLRLWERVLIVLGRAFFPEQAACWGSRSPTGFTRAFVVAARHPHWGAAMAERAGASPLAVALIRRHQDPPPEPPRNAEEHLLRLLQEADNQK